MPVTAIDPLDARGPLSDSAQAPCGAVGVRPKLEFPPEVLRCFVRNRPDELVIAEKNSIAWLYL